METAAWCGALFLLFSLGSNVLRRSNASTSASDGGLAGIAQSGGASGAFSPKEYKKVPPPERPDSRVSVRKHASVV